MESKNTISRQIDEDSLLEPKSVSYRSMSCDSKTSSMSSGEEDLQRDIEGNLVSIQLLAR